MGSSTATVSVGGVAGVNREQITVHQQCDMSYHAKGTDFLTLLTENKPKQSKAKQNKAKSKNGMNVSPRIQ